VLLAACGQEPEPDSTASASNSSESAGTPTAPSTPDDSASTEDDGTLQRLTEDPAALREAMRDPEQREALIEAMRERRAARRAESEDGDADRAAVRERMRERRAEMMAERGTDDTPPRERMRERMLERDRWWNDEDLQASIGLDEAQSEALTQAQLQVEAQRQTMRQQLGEQQQNLIAAVREGERSNILDLIEQRSRTQQALQELELEWWRTMLDQLSDEQLATLAEQNPQLLMRSGNR
jgi:hypothetical protein